MSKVGIIDYGVGNIGSVINMLRIVGAEKVSVVTSPSQIGSLNKLILPGVGAFDRGMKLLIDSGFDSALKNLNTETTEVLGICLGMQLLTEGSEEGTLPGLGLIPGKITKFKESFTHGLPIPHMGWNIISTLNQDYLFEGISDRNRFYFVHSFYYPFSSSKFITSITNYEEPFASSIRKGNVAGVQFHPEKSHSFGKLVLKNFIEHV